MAEKKFDAQVNYGWGLSLNMTGKAPAVAKRIFNTYADALAYANDVNDSAIEGLVLSVVADTNAALNGVYFVQQAASKAVEANDAEGIKAADAKEAILVKLGSEANANGGVANVEGKLTQEIADRKAADKAITDSIGTVAEGKTVMGTVTEEVGKLNTAISKEQTARENAFNTLKGTLEDRDAKTLEAINDELDAVDAKIGTVTENKTVVQMIADAETAAKAAATKMKLVDNEELLTLSHTTDEAGAITYTLGTNNVASDAELQTEINRALEAERVLTANLTAEKTRAEGIERGLETRLAAVEGDYLKASDKADLNNAITDETTRAEGKEGELLTAITNESTARTAEDNAINTKIGNVAEGKTVVGMIDDAKKALIGDAATDYNTLGKLEDKILAVEGAAKSYSIAKATDEEVGKLGTNVKEAYKLIENGKVQVGEYIPVYKDSSLKSAVLNGQKLVFTYTLADETEQVVEIDVSSFLAESEFKNGLSVNDNGEVSVKVDATSEDFLTVGDGGVKLSGVQTAIDNAIAAETQNRTNAINALNATAGTQAVSEGKHVAVQVVETAGKLTNVTVTEKDIASAKELDALETAVGDGFSAEKTVAKSIADNTKAINDEANTRKADDDAINAKIGTVGTGTTVVEMIEEAKAAAIAASTVVAENSDFITVTKTGEVGKTQTYTITTQDIASETATTKAINDEKTAREKAMTAETATRVAAEAQVLADAKAYTDTEVKKEADRAKGIEDGLNSRLTTVEGDYVKSVESAEGSMITVSETEQKVTLSLQWGTF